MDLRDLNRLKFEFDHGRNHPVTVAVRLEGSVCKEIPWSGINKFGPLVPDVISALKYLRYNLDCKIIVYTTRTNCHYYKNYTAEQLIHIVRKFLNDHNVPCDMVAVEAPSADFYVDKKGIRFRDWKATLSFITKRVKILENKENLSE